MSNKNKQEKQAIMYKQQNKTKTTKKRIIIFYQLLNKQN